MRCSVALAGADLGRYAAAAADPAAAAQVAARFDFWGKGRLAGVDGRALLGEIVAQGERFRVRTHAPALAAKPVLLVAGLRDEVVAPDEMAEPMLEALQQSGAATAELVVLDADHSFTSRRIALARAVVGFLDRECR